MRFRHALRPEGYPLPPTIWLELVLRPAFFFDRDPRMTFNPGTLSPSAKSGTQ
jgi:Cu2+-containing amine oxidase